MMKTKSRSTLIKFGSRGCTTNIPIMPIAICTISSEVGMVHKRTAVLHREPVDEGLARRDVRPCQATDAVHSVRQEHAMPVDCCVLGQFVCNEDTDFVAFDALNGRSR